MLIRTFHRSFCSQAARPMTRFVQYPFDKTKMEEVSAWMKSDAAIQGLGKIKGVTSFQLSFCPGEGWLGAHYLFDDLDSLLTFKDDPNYKPALDAVLAHPLYDSSRQ